SEHHPLRGDDRRSVRLYASIHDRDRPASQHPAGLRAVGGVVLRGRIQFKPSAQSRISQLPWLLVEGRADRQGRLRAKQDAMTTRCRFAVWLMWLVLPV